MQTAAFFPGVQAQVELGGTPFPLDHAQPQARRRAHCLNVRHLRLVVVHHLKQRVVAQVALQFERFNQLFKRQLLMGLRTESGLFDRAEQLGH